MKEKKAAIMIFIGSLYFFGLHGISFSAAEEIKPQEVSAQNKPQAGDIVRPKEEFEAQGLRDPFRSYFEESAVPGENGESDASRVPEVPLPDLTVQGIICGGRLNQAIINNKVVRVGDTIEDVLVTNIDKSGITVFFSNKSYKITSPAVNTMQDLEKKPEGGQDAK